MRSISSPASADADGVRARISIVVCAVLLTALTAFGVWKVSATEARRAHTVVIEGMQFSPSSMRIRPGDQVTFRNNDLVPHTATSKGSETFDSGIIKPGESWTVTPPAAQTLRYVCSFHPMMEGEIVVDTR